VDLEGRAQLVDLLRQLEDNDLLQWALIEHGDVRSDRGRQVLIDWKRRDVARLALSLGMTTAGGSVDDMRRWAQNQAIDSAQERGTDG
jgi:hypothetical protein